LAKSADTLPVSVSAGSSNRRSNVFSRRSRSQKDFSFCSFSSVTAALDHERVVGDLDVDLLLLEPGRLDLDDDLALRLVDVRGGKGARSEAGPLEHPSHVVLHLLELTPRIPSDDRCHRFLLSLPFRPKNTYPAASPGQLATTPTLATNQQRACADLKRNRNLLAVGQPQLERRLELEKQTPCLLPRRVKLDLEAASGAKRPRDEAASRERLDQLTTVGLGLQLDANRLGHNSLPRTM